MASTLDQLTEVMIEVFDDDDLVITRETSAADVPAWDSLMHVTLMLQVEAAFGVQFSSADVTGLKDVGALVDLIEAKRS